MHPGLGFEGARRCLDSEFEVGAASSAGAAARDRGPWLGYAGASL